MADQRISDLARDPANGNVARGDEGVITRNGVDYRAEFDGPLFLPQHTSLDAGKVLSIDPTTFAATWTGFGGTEFRRVYSVSNIIGFSSRTLPSDVANYREYYLVVVRGTSGNQTNRGMYLPKGTFTSYAPDGSWQAWFTSNYTQLNWQVNDGGDPVNRLLLYAR